MITHLPSNTKGRDLIIGDLHGCFDELMDKLQDAKFDKSVDRLFSVGDLIDRGDKSINCLSLLNENWFYAVQGNHEDMMVSCVFGGGDWELWKINGGKWAIKVIEEYSHVFLHELAKRVDDLPLVIVVGEGDQGFNVFHAEFYGSQGSLESGNYDYYAEMGLLWNRSWNWDADFNPNQSLKPTFVGHTIVTEPRILGRITNLDTGCFDTGILTMYDFTNKVFI